MERSMFQQENNQFASIKDRRYEVFVCYRTQKGERGMLLRMEVKITFSQKQTLQPRNLTFGQKM